MIHADYGTILDISINTISASFNIYLLQKVAFIFQNQCLVNVMNLSDNETITTNITQGSAQLRII